MKTRDLTDFFSLAGKTDRADRLWGATNALDARADTGAIYRIDPAGRS